MVTQYKKTDPTDNHADFANEVSAYILDRMEARGLDMYEGFAIVSSILGIWSSRTNREIGNTLRDVVIFNMNQYAQAKVKPDA